jgi:CheY-like chemotaxis protein
MGIHDRDTKLATETAWTEDAAATGGRVMVLDDEVMITSLVSSVLAPGCEVSAFSRADEALARIRAGDRFDVILCDLMMPHMTGMEFHDAIRVIAPDQAERTVFLTGGTFTPRASAFLERVHNTRIEKPFELGALSALVRERIALSRSSVPA